MAVLEKKAPITRVDAQLQAQQQQQQEDDDDETEEGAAAGAGAAKPLRLKKKKQQREYKEEPFQLFPPDSEPVVLMKSAPN